MDIEYNIDRGVSINGCDLPWGISREASRVKLGLPFQVQDTVMDFSEYGIDKVIEQRRDIYGEYSLGGHYIFLGFDMESNLKECELHLFSTFRIGEIAFAHGQPIDEVLDQLGTMSAIWNQDGNQCYEFPVLKLAVASSEGMGGDEGDNGLSYVYVALNVDHWKQ